MKKKIVFLTVAVTLFFAIMVSGCSASADSPVGLVASLEKMIGASIPGDKGRVLATLEGDNIYKKVFDLQLEMFLQNQGKLTPAQQIKMKNDPAFLKKFLNNMIYTKIIIKEMSNDSAYKNNTELTVFLHLALSEALKQYYISKKTSTNFDTNVSSKEIETLYNKMKKVPRYRKLFSRAPMDKIKQLLKSQILQQRQQMLMQQTLDKLKSKYRIDLKDNAFGRASVPVPNGKKTK